MYYLMVVDKEIKNTRTLSSQEKLSYKKANTQSKIKIKYMLL
jgi:hypothetical protein